MRIIIVLYKDSERVGGSIRVAEVLARYLIDKGVDVKFAFAYDGAGRLGEIFDGLCHYFGASGRKDLKTWLEYRNFLENQKPSLVHYVDNVGWMMVASSFLSIRRVSHLHYRPDAGVNAGYKRYFTMRFVFSLSDGVIAISNGAKNNLVELCGVSKEKVHVVHNSVHSGYLSGSESSYLSRRGSVKIGMAVRVVKDKGVEDAIRLLLHLPDKYYLVIAGDGPDREYMEEKALVLGVLNRIEWLGSIRNISELYSNIDFYAYMSWYEGFGLSVAEAMYCGVPVVGLLGDGEISEEEYPLVTNCNSLLISRSKIGAFEVEPNDKLLKALAKNIEDLENNEGKMLTMTSNAKVWVEQRFSEDRFGHGVVSVYERVLGP
ncbi:glycosyltransferase family 4 protein [Halomonas sp. HK25]|uniref:glycosyltransferase family 4 protein n=1 Tax=Halomonas sp. HK25 TaxID=3394321 RepID=UPI0039FD07B3